MNRLNFVDDDKIRKREKEIRDIERNRDDYYTRQIPDRDIDDDLSFDDIIKRKNLNIAKQNKSYFNNEDNSNNSSQKNTSFSKNQNNDESIFKSLSLVFGLTSLVLVVLIITFFTTGVYKTPDMNISCSPNFNEGNVSLRCGDVNSTLTCPQINLSQSCIHYLHNYTNYTYVNYTNHS